MIRNILLLIFTLTVGFVTYADEYLPLLREGVKWVYSEEFHDIYNINEGDINLSDSRKYTIELRGDTVIAGETYKKCYRVCDNEVNWTELAFSKTQPVAFLREEGKKVYGRMKMVKKSQIRKGLMLLQRLKVPLKLRNPRSMKPKEI